MLDWKTITANGNAEKMALAKRRKRDFDYLMSGLLKELQCHLLASIHFKSTYSWLLFLPSILITLLSGIFAVLIKSGVGFSERSQSLLALMIAILSAYSVFWQSLMKQLNYGGRANLHDSAASSLRKIYDMTLMISREKEIKKLEVKDASIKSSNSDTSTSIGEEKTEEISDNSNHGGSSKKGEEGLRRVVGDIPSKVGKDNSHQTTEEPAVESKDYLTLSRQYEQAVQGCESVVPIRIAAAFNAMESRVAICNQSLIHDKKTTPKIAWEMVYPALYHQLTITIIGAKGWPFCIPEAEWAVKKALADFKEILSFDKRQESDLLHMLVTRAVNIDNEYNSLPGESKQAPITRTNDGIIESSHVLPLLSYTGGDNDIETHVI